MMKIIGFEPSAILSVPLDDERASIEWTCAFAASECAAVSSLSTTADSRRRAIS